MTDRPNGSRTFIFFDRPAETITIDKIGREIGNRQPTNIRNAGAARPENAVREPVYEAPKR